MGGRHTYAFGNDVPFKWETVGFFQGYKILKGKDGIHKLPEEAHSSEAYVQLYPDGNLQMIRFYDEDKFLTVEIGFHPEPVTTITSTTSTSTEGTSHPGRNGSSRRRISRNTGNTSP